MKLCGEQIKLTWAQLGLHPKIRFALTYWYYALSELDCRGDEPIFTQLSVDAKCKGLLTDCENTLLSSMRRKRMYSGDQGVTVLVEHLSQKD
jgi:hypothetical protein